MFKTLSQNAISAFKIKDLLKKVYILKASPLVANFVIEIGLLVDQITADLICKQETTNNQEAKKVSRS